MIAQVLPVLLLELPELPDAQKRHIKKINSFRDAFQVIDFSNPSSDSLRTMLLQLVTRPSCLAQYEGRVFLASLFRDQILLPDLHRAIKVQIPEAKKTMLEAFGDIYQRAWKEIDDSSDIVTKDAMECDVLQDLIHSLIHVSSRSMFTSILTVLEAFHSDRKSVKTSDLLYRLYNPILWRSLSSSNPFVRKNAVNVLEYVFPLHCSSEHNIQSSIEKGCEALFRALQDKHDIVREAGSTATARVCSLFWDALPSTTIRELLNCIILDHASDKGSAGVRAAAVKAVTLLLGSPESHAVLRPLLPSLGNLIHDRAQRVRLATLSLLKCIKAMPKLRFYHVVSVDHLTARLIEEEKIYKSSRNKVAREISSLLLSSYFPQGPKVSASDQVQRTVAFMISDPRAARVFYANLPYLLEDSSITRLVSMLWSCLESAISAESESKNTSREKKRKRGTSESDQAVDLSSTNLPLMSVLVQAIHSLVESPLATRDKGSSIRTLRAHLDPNMILHAIQHFGDKLSSDQIGTIYNGFSQIWGTLIKCAAVLSRDDADTLQYVLDSLHNEMDRQESFSEMLLPHLSLICSWGVDEFSEALAVALESNLDSEDLMPGNDQLAPPKMLKKGLCFPSKYACAILDHALRDDNASSGTIRDFLLSSSKACDRLFVALRKSFDYAEVIIRSEPSIVTPFQDTTIDSVLLCCELYGRLALHEAAHQSQQIALDDRVRCLLDWTSNKVLPVCIDSSQNTLHNLNISRISISSDAMLFSETEGPALTDISAHGANTPIANEKKHSSSRHLAKAVGMAVLQSVLSLTTDLLTLRGDFADEISTYAISWSDTIYKNTHHFESPCNKESDLGVNMLPHLIRLAVYLARSSNNYNLRKHLLLLFDTPLSSDQRLTFERGVQSMLQDPTQMTVPALVACLLAVLDECLEVGSVDNLPDEIMTKIRSSAAGCALAHVIADKGNMRILSSTISETKNSTTPKFRANFFPAVILGLQNEPAERSNGES